MSRYSKLLTKIIAESGYTAKEIVEKCNELGNGIDTTRLSKLQNGKLSAPSDKVSRDLARVCNVDERKLVIEGYLEKAPKEILDIIISLRNNVLFAGLEIFENEIPKEQLEIIKKEFEKEPLSDFMISLVDNNQEEIGDFIENNMELEDLNILQLKEPLALVVNDNGMFPKILENSKIILQIQKEYNDFDILAVKLKKTEELLVRFAIIKKDEIILKPLNNKFDTVQYNLKDIIILGRVTKVITDI